MTNLFDMIPEEKEEKQLQHARQFAQDYKRRIKSNADLLQEVLQKRITWEHYDLIVDLRRSSNTGL